MRKGFFAVVLLMTALLLSPAPLAFARGGGGWGHGGFHGGFHGHGGGGVGVFIGPGFWWGAPWWWGPAYPYYADPYYAAPPVVVPQDPPAYIQQQPAPSPPAYWYYCPNSQAYYPYVRECTSGWLTVVPPSAAPPSGPTP
jgi:hypothetical protein